MLMRLSYREGTHYCNVTMIHEEWNANGKVD